MHPTGTVFPFPPRLRIVAAPVDQPSPEQVDLVTVDHAGHTYRLADLLVQLSPADLAQIEAAAPRTGQAAWAEVVRCWPALADEVVAGCAVRIR